MEEIERKLARIEEMLQQLYERIERIEEVLGLDLKEPLLVITLAQLFELPVSKAVESALRIKRALKVIKSFDPIERAIIEVLSLGDWMTISEITRLVRMIRGKASRTTIRERICRLEDKGVVEVRHKSNRTLVRLKV